MKMIVERVFDDNGVKKVIRINVSIINNERFVVRQEGVYLGGVVYSGEVSQINSYIAVAAAMLEGLQEVRGHLSKKAVQRVFGVANVSATCEIRDALGYELV
jgi:hypothetical protein